MICNAHFKFTAVLMHNGCMETSCFFGWLVNCPTVSDMFLSSDGKLFLDS